MAKNKIAVIGIGGWGKNIVRVLYELDSLAAICDWDNKKCDLYTYEYNVPIKLWSEILADQQITAVAIALPANLHEQYTIEALLANKHVFVEKPLAMSYSAAQALSKICMNNHKVLMVGHILQYHNAYIKLKELITAGAIGKINYLESTRLHFGPVRADIGIIWELMPHDLSMILGIITTPLRDIQVRSQALLNHDAAIIDVNLEFENNIKARVYSSWLHPKKEQKFWVAGTNGMLIFEDTQPWDHKLKLYKYGAQQPGHLINIVEDIKLVADEPLKAQMRHFIDCVNNNKIPISNYNEGTHVVKVLDEIATAAGALEPLCAFL